MKTQTGFVPRTVGAHSAALALVVVLGSSIVASAEDDMMGSMPPNQPAADKMKDTSTDTMVQDHERLIKDHKRMMKKKSTAQTTDQKMGKMKKKKMPMNTEPMASDKADTSDEPMPADEMKHM